MKAVTCETLVDGRSDDPREDAVVLVEDGTVVDVVDDGDAPADTERIDHSSEHVLPGLTDAHCHVSGWREMDPEAWLSVDLSLHTARAVADLGDLLAAGFTAARDLGSPTGPGLREAVAEGTVDGPRIYTSGRLLTQTAGHADLHDVPEAWLRDNESLWFTRVDGVGECRRATRRLLRQKFDSDALDQPQFTDAEVAAVTEEAHRIGVPVASHAQGPAGIRRAVENGVDTVEHGTYIDQPTAELLAETDTVLVPTLSTMARRISEATDDEIPESSVDRLREVQRRHFESVATAREHGVDVALGTDFLGTDLLPHGENALEAELLVEAGLTEMDAIRAATGVAARTVRDESLGSVEPGCYADLVVLDRDPLADVSALRDVTAVYWDGERVA